MVRPVPEWYKKLEFIPEDKPPVNFTGTARNCMSFLDALSMGWILTTPCDIGWEYYGHDDGVGQLNWRANTNFKPMEFHRPEQLGDFPIQKPIVKFLNPFVIKTPPGYSCLFTHPFNRPHPFFHHFSGVVETDRYYTQVNGAAVWAGEPDTQGVIKRDTPYAQIIPFKRDTQLREAVTRSMTHEEEQERQQYSERLNSERGFYRKHVWISDKSTRVREPDEGGS